MWGASSFNDLAKRAAEMQEQAAASITSSSPATPSFSMGGMFNMDSLQQQDEQNPDKKGDDLKKLAQQAMSQAKADAAMNKASTFYNPLAQQQSAVKKVSAPQQQNRPQQPASKLKMPQSFLSTPSNTNSRTTASSKGPTIAMKNNNRTQKPKATIGTNQNLPLKSATPSLSLGTSKSTPAASPAPSKNLFPSSDTKTSLSAPKGKLALPVNKAKSTTVAQPVAAISNSAIPSGSNTLKTKPPASSLVTPRNANKSSNSNVVTPGLLVGTKNKPAPKSVAATNPAVPTIAPKESQSTKTTINSKLISPKKVSKLLQQQTSAPTPKELAPPKDSSKSKQQNQQPAQQQATAKPAATGKSSASEAQPQNPNNPQQQKSATLPTTTTPTTVSKIATKQSKTAPAASASTTTSTKETAANTSNVASEANPDSTAAIDQQETTKISSQVNEEKKTGVDEEVLREQLQRQQEVFEKKLEEQRLQAEGKMQELQNQFSEQLQRLEEHHRQEIDRIETEQKTALAHWQQQVRDREMLLKSQSQEAESNDATSQATINSLTSQLKQARELIADKDKEGRKLQEAHLQQLRQMEKQCNKKEDTSNSLGQEILNLEKKLEESKKKTESVSDDHEKLKQRAKKVAEELKERRAECRTLTSEIDLLEDAKNSLQERITQLEAKGMDMNQSSEETQAKLDSMKASLDDTKQELKETKDAMKAEKTKAEKAMSNYKKKAQQSLALANARSAAAVQAREEAEMDARAARATSDTAMERSMKAELNGKQALAEAKVYVDNMKEEVAKYESVKAELDKTSKELKLVQTEAETNKTSNEKLRCELTSLAGRLEAEQVKNGEMKESQTAAQNRSNELYDEVERLRQSLQFQKEEIKRITEDKKEVDSSLAEEEAAAIARAANSESEATISMLQQEVQDRDKAIKELKETLAEMLSKKDIDGDGHQSNGGYGTMNGNHREPENGMPLFYAMEKQAELSQARDEIARMANLLGDAESTKQSALDDMEHMRQMMEEAQSKLQRQEQLQSKTPGEQQSINVEYLKNIVLSYLNAETIQEKKSLLPVIGTVLCLTPVEFKMANDQLDKGKSSVMEGVASSVLGGLWS